MKITIENTIPRKETLEEITQLVNLAVQHKTVKSFMDAAEKLTLEYLKIGNGGSHVWVKEVLFDQVTGERIIMFTEEEYKKPELRLKKCGRDEFSRMVYKSEAGSYYKDIEDVAGSGAPAKYTGIQNLYFADGFDGEPSYPVRKDLEIIFTDQPEAPTAPVAEEEVEVCALCGTPDQDKQSDYLRHCYKVSQDKLGGGYFRPYLTQDEMRALQRGENPICSNRRKCAARQVANRIKNTSTTEEPKPDLIYVHDNGKTKSLTRKQFDKLPDCEVQKSDLVSWGGGYKFFRRSKGWVTVLIRVNENDKKDEYLTVSYKCNKVRIDGTVLPYISKYKFTNGKQPFPKQQ